LVTNFAAETKARDNHTAPVVQRIGHLLPAMQAKKGRFSPVTPVQNVASIYRRNRRRGAAAQALIGLKGSAQTMVCGKEPPYKHCIGFHYALFHFRHRVRA